MIIVYGTRLFGRADSIDGVGHVACRFVHIMFVPLVPLETVFLLDDDRGMKLPFSFKAAVSGWFRGGSLFSGIAGVLAGIANVAEGQPLLGAVLIGFGLFAFAMFPVWGWIFGHCSAGRRAELMAMLGIQEDAGGANAASPHPMHFAHAPQPVPAGPPPPPGGFGHPAPYGAQPNYGPYGAPPPNYGAPPPNYGAPPPNYGAPPPNYGAPPPNYGAAPPNYGAAPPNYGGPPPNWGPSGPPRR
jgi:hypothetical protein